MKFTCVKLTGLVLQNLVFNFLMAFFLLDSTFSCYGTISDDICSILQDFLRNLSQDLKTDIS